MENSNVFLNLSDYVHPFVLMKDKVQREQTVTPINEKPPGALNN